MVGVAGRSKACHTCKQRRIACSLERPHCVQCVKVGRQCAGYQRERVFIVDGKTSVAAKKILSKTMQSESTQDLCTSSHTSSLATSSNTSQAVLEISAPWLTTNRPNLSIINPNAAYRQQLLGAFHSCCTPIALLGPKEERISWFMLLAEVSTPTEALEKSTLAVCTAGIGRANKDPMLIRESLRLYTQAIQQLQKVLREPGSVYKDETLGICMALATYELMECPASSKSAYLSHHNGCARLVQLRGADAHTSGLGHQLFLVYRTQGILKALEDHRPTYLSEITWKHLPWKNKHKRPFDELLDIFVLAPDIFQQTDQFDKLEPRRRLLSVLRVVEQCWKADESLKEFLHALDCSNPGPLYWPEFSERDSSTDDPVLGRLFPVAFHFLDLRMAKMMMLYWAILTMLWSGMTKLYQLLSVLNIPALPSGDPAGISRIVQFNSNILPPLEHRTAFLTMATNVCQSVEYCMQEEMLGLGPQSVVAPLSIVADTLKEYLEYSREVAWAKEILDILPGRGMRILRHLNNK